jgi:hypothetical protein
VGVLTGVYWRTIAGAYNLNNRFDSRGINNDKSDVFTWLKLERGQQPATANIVMKGTTAVQAEIQSLPDPCRHRRGHKRPASVLRLRGRHPDRNRDRGNDAQPASRGGLSGSSR